MMPSNKRFMRILLLLLMISCNQKDTFETEFIGDYLDDNLITINPLSDYAIPLEVVNFGEINFIKNTKEKSLIFLCIFNAQYNCELRIYDNGKVVVKRNHVIVHELMITEDVLIDLLGELYTNKAFRLNQATLEMKCNLLTNFHDIKLNTPAFGVEYLLHVDLESKLNFYYLFNTKFSQKDSDKVIEVRVINKIFEIIKKFVIEQTKEDVFIITKIKKLKG